MRNLEMDGPMNGHVPSTAPEPIAIVGMGLRLPGKVHSPEALWELLVNGRETSGPVPPSRYNAAGFYSASKNPASTGVQRGHFLDESDGLDLLDTSFFSMSKSEVEKLDPQQRMLLEVVWECMENAGQTDWRGSNTGVFVGTWGDDWLDFLAKDPLQTGGMLNVSGAGDFAISNRISYEYNLNGPSMTIKAACASSMICLHNACQSLRDGGCSAAIVAGTNLIITPTQTIAQTEAGVLSPTGQCRTFDASANGYARGEAINAIFIKRLSDALRDRDPIRAIIRSTAVNCDGRSNGFSSPNPKAHEKMIRQAYRVAGLYNPSDTPFVEVHGTGTPSGDPLELQAIASVFGRHQDTYVGSIKANVGHGEGASGLTSIIKAVMMLQHRKIPPQVNFVTPNPKIPFEAARLVVPLETMDWPTNRPERISVNSFGITGANAHSIIESAASYGFQPRLGALVPSNATDLSFPSPPRLLVISANTPESLKRRAKDLQRFAEANPKQAKDLSYTLACRRTHLSHRAFCITGAKDVTFATERITQTPTINFVFTGQGAQWPTMGKELAECFPEFRDDLVRLGRVLSQSPHPPAWDLIDELMKPEDESRLNKAEFAQPLCTAIQIALVNQLSRLGVTPSAVVGHSSGEIAAAYAAGAITASEAILVAYYRGRITLNSTRKGAMAAVGMGRAEAALYLEDGVVVACDNSPNSVTLSGDTDALETVIDQMKSDDPDVFVRLLRTDGMAYHSHLMQEMGPEYEQLLQPVLHARPPKLPFFSSVSGKLAAGTVFGPEYWRSNLESPVKFFPAAKTMIESQQGGAQLCLEIGPHSALSGPLRQIFKATTAKGLTYLPSLVRGENSAQSLLKTCGQLFLQMVDVKLEQLNHGASTLTNVPVYPWQHDTHHWTESRAVREWRTRSFPPHELLGARILEGNDVEPTWRNLLRLKDAPWLHDHRVLSDVVFPCAGYVAMVGEAVQQLTGADDYSIRNLNIKTAMILNEDKTVEVVTSLRHPSLSGVDDTEWYEFCIYSHNGNTWTKHCNGEARAGRAKETAGPQVAGDITPLPRQIQSPYAIFTRVGLHYGPTFQGLRDLSVMPGCTTAAASFNHPPRTGSAYALHPTTIDQCLQLLGLASAEGLSHHFEQILLPTGIEQLYISSTGEADAPMKGTARASPDTGRPGDIHGEMTVLKNGKVLLSVQGCRLSRFEQQQKGDLERDERIAAARLSWRPDLDFIPLDSLMISRVKDLEALRLMETYVFLSTVEMQQRIRGSKSCAEHFEKFRHWIDALVNEGQIGNNRIVSNSKELVQLSESDRLALLTQLQGELKTSEFVHVAELVTRLLDHCVAVFEGEREILDIYLQDNGLTKLYNITGDRIDSTEFFVTAGHTNPNLRVLEIGGGTGGTTLLALQALTSINGEPMYANYTFTDVSSGFFSAAKERFSAYPGLEFKTLDIGKDPADQGFDTGAYDLIIASNVIHATEKLNTTLKNVRKLLHPRGRFFLQELTPAAAKMINLIMGPLPGWWLGEADGRATEPIVSPDRWELELRNAGFAGIECVVYDDPNQQDHLGVNIIARPTQTVADFRGVTLLVRESEAHLPPVKLVEQAFIDQGYHIDICFLGAQLPVFQDVVSLLELNSPLFSQVSADEFASFQNIVASLGSSRMLWVMQQAQGNLVDDPNYGMTLGLMRSIRAELSPAIATLEIDNVDARTTEAIQKVLEKYQETASSVNPDQEYLIKDGVVHVGRYHWTGVCRELAESNDSTDQPLKLEIRRQGRSKECTWVPYPPVPLGKNDVTILPAYAGVSIKGTGEEIDLQSLDGSGSVVAVGSDVKSVQVGDRVIVLGYNCLSTSITVSTDNIVRIPDGLGLEDAGTMPLAYATSIYSLFNVANIKKGQSVLIDVDIDSISIAAIKLCQMVGAEIYCTVRHGEAVEYLNASLDIPHDHIFSPPKYSCLSDIMSTAGHRGVDVALSTTSSDLLQVIWKCVSPRGKMVCLGKGEFTGQFNLDLFSGNRSFVHVDITTLQDLYPELLNETLDLYNQGSIQPIVPHVVIGSDESDIRFEAISQKTGAWGGLLCKIPSQIDTNVVATKQPELKLREDASYLLVGGLGGLGQSVSTYMVEHGARHFIYLSRSSGESDEHKRFFLELESQGCTVQAMKGDVANPDDVARAVQDARWPIAGVLQMAMVLNDRPFMSMSYDDWLIAIKPKVNGTYNLHQALLPNELDFFVMFGSISGSFGIAHQVNYAAGNTFQDSFVRYRHSRGLPASVLNIGAMAGVGYVSQNQGVEEYFHNAGMPFLSEGDFFEALHLSIRQQSSPPKAHSLSGPGVTNKSQLALGIRATKPMEDRSNRVLWKHDRRVDIYRNIEAARLQHSTTGGSQGEEDKLSKFMAEVRAGSSVLYQTDALTFLTHEIGKHIYEFMLQPVEELDISKAFVTLGVDSLVIVEIRNWLRRKLDVEASTLEILNGGTIEMLGQICVERLQAKYGKRV